MGEIHPMEDNVKNATDVDIKLHACNRRVQWTLHLTSLVAGSLAEIVLNDTPAKAERRTAIYFPGT